MTKLSMTCIAFSALALSFAAAGCSSSSNKDEKPLGTAQVGAYTLTVAQEGTVAAGAQTRFVMKATAGGKPTSITGWIGVANGDGSTKKLAVYDAGDGDFDDDVAAPTPLPADAKFWFEIDTNGNKDVGSIAFVK